MLLRAIKSVLNQTLAVHEILVCDDGSTDDSKKKVEALNDPKVIWIECGRNGRPAIPRNIGIRKSTGNWLAFLDNDDEWLPEKIELQVNSITQFDVNAVCTNAYKITNGNNIGAFNTILKNNQILNFYNLIVSNHIICSSVLIKKETVLAYTCFPEELALKALEDYALWLKVSTTHSFYFLNKCLVNYNDESITSIRKESLTTPQQLNLIFNDFKNWYLKNSNLCEDYMLSILEQLFIIRFLNKKQKFVYKLFKAY